jgi:hypothetical protein
VPFLSVSDENHYVWSESSGHVRQMVPSGSSADTALDSKPREGADSTNSTDGTEGHGADGTEAGWGGSGLWYA